MCIRDSYRIIDFKRNKFNVNGNVQRIEYDPYRSAFIALISPSKDSLREGSDSSVSRQPVKGTNSSITANR